MTALNPMARAAGGHRQTEHRRATTAWSSGCTTRRADRVLRAGRDPGHRDGDEILPIEYSDNYVTVFPGETVEVHGVIPTGAADAGLGAGHRLQHAAPVVPIG